MIVTQTLFNFIHFIIQYIAYTPLLILLNKQQIKNKKCIFFTILGSLFSAIFSVISPNLGVVNIIYILLIFIGSTYIFKADKTSTLAFTIICASVSFVTNILCLSFNKVVFYNIDSLLYLLMFSIILLITYNFFYNKDMKIFKDYFSVIPDSYFILLIIMLSHNFLTLININTAYISFCAQFCVVGFLIQDISTKSIINDLKINLYNSNIKYNKIKSVNDGIRMFKHDYNNTLCSIGGYIALNDMNGLQKFYNKLTYDMAKVNTAQIINPATINEPSIYNLLIRKHNDIIRKNLKFNFYSAINYKDLSISPYEFSKLLRYIFR